MPDLGALGNYGLPGVMLAVFIWLFLSSRKESRSDRDQMRMDLLTNRQECKAENDKLVARVQHLEDRAHEVQTEVLRACTTTLQTSADALKSNAEAFHRLTDTGRYPARKE